MMLSPGLRANTLLLPASLNLANAQDWKERLIAALTLNSNSESRWFRDNACHDTRHPDPACGRPIGKIERRQNRFNQSLVSP